MKIRMFIASAILIILISCQKKYMSDSIFYMNEVESIDMGYPYGSIIYKGSYDGVYHSINKELINSNVIEVIETNNFLLVKQKFDEKLIKKQIYDDLKHIVLSIDSIRLPHGKVAKTELMHWNYYDTKADKFNENRIISIVDSIVKKDPYYLNRMINVYNYYIINLKTEEITGPLSQSSFIEEIQKQKINEDISSLIGALSQER